MISIIRPIRNNVAIDKIVCAQEPVFFKQKDLYDRLWGNLPTKISDDHVKAIHELESRSIPVSLGQM